jgi:glycerate kinase
LGARFFDADGRELPPGGLGLARLDRIDDRALRARIDGVSIDIACDVDNPLIGTEGAAAVYGPQKGASPDDIRRLDAALSRFADVIVSTTGADVRRVPGAGAAGGIAGGFLGLAGARLVPGSALVLDVIGFDGRLDDVRLVVTGEGRLDRQSLAGKAPYAVAQAARKRGIAVVAVAGVVDLRGDDYEKLGISDVESVVSASVSMEEAMRDAANLTADAAERLARRIGPRL